MRRRLRPETPPRVDQEALATFRQGLRRRYSDREILTELEECARRLGRSPTMREFAADPATGLHPQTVVERFGSWNEAKRRAGLVPRRFATREDLLNLLRQLGDDLGRVPTAKDLDARRKRMPSTSLYWHTFGSFTEALRAAGFDVPVGEERLERAIVQGVAIARKLGHLPRFADWREARLADPALLTEWQVYRMLEAGPGAWPTLQYLVRERLLAEGASVEPDGTVKTP
jgi:Homing endonuclease associated repeat